MTGSGKSASWQIRGEQLGEALGAHRAPLAASLPLDVYDITVLVKRPTAAILGKPRAIPVVWDVLDAWPQPRGNEWDQKACLSWLRAELGQVRPDAAIGATQMMARDLRRFGVEATCVPHHARPGQRVNPIRAQVAVVGYEGGPNYLGRWGPIVERECARRGWRFVVNGFELAEVDIVLALRDCTGYAPRSWKSNVKLANAQGSGTPCVLAREAGYIETRSGGERWADSEEELAQAFDELTPAEARREAQSLLLTGAPRLEDVAKEYADWLLRLRF